MRVCQVMSVYSTTGRVDKQGARFVPFNLWTCRMHACIPHVVSTEMLTRVGFSDSIRIRTTKWLCRLQSCRFYSLLEFFSIAFDLYLGTRTETRNWIALSSWHEERSLSSSTTLIIQRIPLGECQYEPVSRQKESLGCYGAKRRKVTYEVTAQLCSVGSVFSTELTFCVCMSVNGTPPCISLAR